MDTRITLKAARNNIGYTIPEAAALIGINKDTVMKYERDSSDIPRSIMMKMQDVYRYPIDNIFFGNESDFFRKKRSSNFENTGM